MKELSMNNYLSESSKRIMIVLEQKLESGMTDKHEIYSAVVDELGVPRPSVRRIARDLRMKYADRVRILQSDLT